MKGKYKKQNPSKREPLRNDVEWQLNQWSGWLRDQEYLIPCRSTDFSVGYRVQIGSATRSAFYSTGTRDKAAGEWSWSLTTI